MVDDDPAALMLMQAALEPAGFAVCVAADGEDALRQFRTAPGDLVMLDVDMPGLDGYQVCARLRREVGDELPIVMLTGMHDLESVEQAFEAGATDFLAKPITINWGLIGHRVRYPSLLTQSYFGVAGVAQMRKKCVNMIFAQPGGRAIFDRVVRGHSISP